MERSRVDEDLLPEWSSDGQWILQTTAGAGGEQRDPWAVPLAAGGVIPLVTTEADERKASGRPPT